MRDHRILFVLIAPLLVSCSTTTESPKVWNAVAEGMNRAAIIGKIGKPDSQTASLDAWHSSGWELRVAYDHNGYATNIVRVLELK